MLEELERMASEKRKELKTGFFIGSKLKMRKKYFVYLVLSFLAGVGLIVAEEFYSIVVPGLVYGFILVFQIIAIAYAIAEEVAVHRGNEVLDTFVDCLNLVNKKIDRVEEDTELMGRVIITLMEQVQELEEVNAVALNKIRTKKAKMAESLKKNMEDAMAGDGTGTIGVPVREENETSTPSKSQNRRKAVQKEAPKSKKIKK